MKKLIIFVQRIGPTHYEFFTLLVTLLVDLEEMLFKSIYLRSKKFQIDFTIINGENSAAGYGITGKIYEDFINWGADAITLGNHAWKKDEIIPYMENNPDHNIIRPLNFSEGSPGQGYKVFNHPKGSKKFLFAKFMVRRSLTFL